MNTSASGFAQPNSSLDVTFDFTFDTAAILNNIHLFDFGGANGASMRLESNRIIFRAYTGTNMLYVASNVLSVSTSYRVTGSIFMNPAAADEMRLYLDEADAVDTGFTHWQPTAEIGATWRGGNAAGYGVVGGGDYLIGTPGSPGNTGPSAIDTGVLGSALDIYQDTRLDVIPEPSTFALCGLGLGALLILRRRFVKAENFRQRS